MICDIKSGGAPHSSSRHLSSCCSVLAGGARQSVGLLGTHATVMQTPRALDQPANCAPALAWASNVLGLEVHELDQVGSAQQARGLHYNLLCLRGRICPLRPNAG